MASAFTERFLLPGLSVRCFYHPDCAAPFALACCPIVDFKCDAPGIGRKVGIKSVAQAMHDSWRYRNSRLGKGSHIWSFHWVEKYIILWHWLILYNKHEWT